MPVTAISVSKRSPRTMATLLFLMAALLCLMAMQLLILASCDGERDPIPMAARVAFSQR